MVSKRLVFKRFNHPAGLLAAVLLICLGACDSSDTRSTLKSATSGENELQVRITTPVDGAIVLFVQEEAGGEYASDTTFNAIYSGGTDPVNLTWQTRGPSTQNTATGESPEITFLETGEHTISVTAVDATGLSASNTIRVNVQAATGGVSSGTGTTTTTSTTTTTTTSTTTTTT